MNIASLFIRRPVMTTLVMLSILLFGIMAYRQLPVSDLPNVDFPAISVNASVPGASPDTMASSVATVLEREFSSISGLDSMVSASSRGSTRITLTFSLNRDIDSAAQDVQAAIARTTRRLPADMPSPPSYSKSNPADSPILFMPLTSDTLSLSELDEYGQTMIAPRISMIDGVAEVQVFGSQKYAVRIRVDPERLFAMGIGIDEVKEAVNKGNVNRPTGELVGKERALTIQAHGQLMRADEYRPLIVAWRNGSPIRLGDIAEITDSIENDRAAAWYCTPGKQERAIMIAVFRQPGRNTVEVAGAVRRLLPTLRRQMPPGVSLNVLFDASTAIQASFHDVTVTLVLTLFLVVGVIFVFLRNLSATLIPSLALPMSLVGTFAVMRVFDFSLDTLSLMALTLAIGFVVDDAIVMLENIVRHMDMGKDRVQAALDGSREISFTIVSMTLSLAAVFIPVLFMGGLVGRIFREFAVTIGAAVLISGFIALTLTPMLAARFLKPSAAAHRGRAYAGTERGFLAMLGFYDRTLRWTLGHGRAVVLFSLIMLALTIVAFWAVPKGFLPSEDRGRLQIQTEAAEGTSHHTLFQLQQQLAAVVQKDPSVEAFMSRAGGGNTGFMFLRLKPRSERPHVDKVIVSLRPKLGSIPGFKAYPVNPPTIPIGGRMSRSQYQFTLQSPDTGELYDHAPELLERVQQMPGFLDVATDMQFRNPELELEIDRDQASALGLSLAQIQETLLAAYGSAQISTIYAANNQYQVILELPPEYQATPAALSLLHVRSSSGALVPLSAFATFREGVGPLSINHTGQLPSVTLSFNLEPGLPLGKALDQVNAAARELLPPTIATSFQGTAQAFQSSLANMNWLLLLAIVVIYIVLGILYENYYHPVTILSALPFAGFGAVLTLMIFRVDLSMYAYVGIIMLVGLVKKNGIMMIDFAIEARRQDNLPPVEAIHKACMIRFRPIMMTTMAALVAGLPIAIGFGAGGEARRPLGLAVVGGLLFSQTLTLYVTPVFYVYMEKFQDWIHRRKETVPA